VQQDKEHITLLVGLFPWPISPVCAAWWKTEQIRLTPWTEQSWQKVFRRSACRGWQSV